MAANDIDKARSTYESFMGTLKWTVPLIAIIAFVVVVMIAP
ncbi:aa3-type cytochrome c oxidase subunit IV [Erythrobacter sp. SCSIO 43205]|nr:aa3-type cytochrome c oxidase subunit IV [Erythrobacter sp. SCSIO 43205]